MRQADFVQVARLFAWEPYQLNIAQGNVTGTLCEDEDMMPIACPWNPVSAYVVTFSATNEVADVAGGTGGLPDATSFTLCFTTDVAP